MYGATITSDNGSDTSFITFDETNKKISWISPPTSGVYSVEVSGTVDTGIES